VSVSTETILSSGAEGIEVAGLQAGPVLSVVYGQAVAKLIPMAYGARKALVCAFRGAIGS